MISRCTDLEENRQCFTKSTLSVVVTSASLGAEVWVVGTDFSIHANMALAQYARILSSSLNSQRLPRLQSWCYSFQPWSGNLFESLIWLELFLTFYFPTPLLWVMYLISWEHLALCFLPLHSMSTIWLRVAMNANFECRKLWQKSKTLILSPVLK